MGEPKTGSKKGSAKKAGTKKRSTAKAGAAKKKATAGGATRSASKKAAGKRTSKNAVEAATAQPAQQQSPAESVLENVKLPSTQGKAGIFGGPRDRGIKPDDKLALPTGQHYVYERVRSLNPKSFYCSMRFDFHIEHKSPEEAKRWWAN
ncbi:MAG TPA: hypothetical protein VFQ92_16035, partial [Blastocatellia bacterium]|nr:hypothetical protein [Blastocatellia bacterium]